MHESAPYGCRTQTRWKFGKVEQPVGVPRGPVGVFAVDDAIHDVMGFGSLVEKLGYPFRWGHGLTIPL